MAEVSFGKVAWNTQVVGRRFPQPFLTDDGISWWLVKAVAGAF